MASGNVGEMSEFRWNGRRERAAALVAEDVQSDPEIARQLGISDRQLLRWKRAPEFAARVAEIVEATRAAVLAEGVANKRNRIEAINDRWRRLQQVIDARAEKHANIRTLAASPAAGAETGLMVLTIRYLPGGGRVEEWAVDTGLLKAMLEHEKQAAVELGQWEEKSSVSGSVLIREYGVTLDEV